MPRPRRSEVRREWRSAGGTRRMDRARGGWGTRPVGGTLGHPGVDREVRRRRLPTIAAEVMGLEREPGARMVVPARRGGRALCSGRDLTGKAEPGRWGTSSWSRWARGPSKALRAGLGMTRLDTGVTRHKMLCLSSAWQAGGIGGPHGPGQGKVIGRDGRDPCVAGVRTCAFVRSGHGCVVPRSGARTGRAQREAERAQNDGAPW
jgi:hypothetical protein